MRSAWQTPLVCHVESVHPNRGNPDRVRLIRTWYYANRKRITSQQIDGYAKGLSSRSQLAALLEHSSNLSQMAVPIERLAGITVDTLIVWGKQDQFLPFEEHAGKLASALPNAVLEPIDDCGHIPQEEKPDETNKLITAFL